MTTSAPTMVATSDDDALKSWGSAPMGITVVTEPPAHSAISPAMLPSTVVVATMVGVPSEGAVASLLAPPQAASSRAAPARGARRTSP